LIWGRENYERVRSTWFNGLLRWRARTNCHIESGCDGNASANNRLRGANQGRVLGVGRGLGVGKVSKTQ